MHDKNKLATKTLYRKSAGHVQREIKRKYSSKLASKQRFISGVNLFHAEEESTQSHPDYFILDA